MIFVSRSIDFNVEALKYNIDRGYRKFDFEESYIKGKKGYSLHRVVWMPESSPKAIIMIVHDIGDHILRYENLAYFFTNEGFGVIGIDLRGHGKSDGKRGCGGYNDLLYDVNELVNQTHKTYPFVPKVLYGNGLGGNLALLYAIKQNDPVQGLIVTSPWIRCRHTHNYFFQSGSSLVTKLFPFLRISNNVNSKYLSHDLAIHNNYVNDKLVHNKISLRLLKEINVAGSIILSNRHKCNIPLLLMHGESDKVTSWHASAEFSRYTSSKTIFKLWDGYYHELHNEFDKEKIFEYILPWLNNISYTKRVIYGSF